MAILVRGRAANRGQMFAGTAGRTIVVAGQRAVATTEAATVRGIRGHAVTARAARRQVAWPRAHADLATDPAVATGLTVATTKRLRRLDDLEAVMLATATVLLGWPTPDTVAAAYARVAAEGRSLATVHPTTGRSQTRPSARAGRWPADTSCHHNVPATSRGPT